MQIIILLAMIYCHIIDDFYLQGILSQMKQYKWWINLEGFNSKYKNDYIVALICHGFSWSCTISIPILVYRFKSINTFWCIVLAITVLINTIIHVYVDNAKANKYQLNLLQDQLIHLAQIIVTFLLLVNIL